MRFLSMIVAEIANEMMDILSERRVPGMKSKV
jgi:hypothetical protein